jgi:hypothetical protein
VVVQAVQDQEPVGLLVAQIQSQAWVMVVVAVLIKAVALVALVAMGVSQEAVVEAVVAALLHLEMGVLVALEE